MAGLLQVRLVYTALGIRYLQSSSCVEDAKVAEGWPFFLVIFMCNESYPTFADKNFKQSLLIVSVAASTLCSGGDAAGLHYVDNPEIMRSPNGQ